MKINVEKKLTVARNAYIAAAKRLAKLKAKYREVASGLYLSITLPNIWDWCCTGETEADEPLTRDTQFISFVAMNSYTHERKDVYKKTASGEWRVINQRDWAKIDRLEIAILDAWDEINDAEHVFFEMSNALPTLF